MPEDAAHVSRRLAAMRAVVCLSFLAGLALSRRVWVGQRVYPRLPAFDGLELSGSVELALVAGLLGCLGACALGLRPRVSGPLVAGCVMVLVAGDLTRLQPWVYQWTAAILVLSSDRARARERLLLLLAAAYAHSGLSKLGDGFATGSFAFVLSPFVDPNALGRSTLFTLAGLAIAAELGLGLLLLAARTRVAAALGLVGMHGFLLLSLGPLGSNWNAVVWPWNLGLVVLLPLVAIGPLPPLRARGNVVLLVLFGFCPLLRAFGWWDHYLSFALYSSDKPSAALYLSAAAYDELPPAVRAFARDDADGYRLSLRTWAMGELGVPPYPEERVYRALPTRFLAAHPSPFPLELEVKVPAVYAGETRTWRATYRTR